MHDFIFLFSGSILNVIVFKIMLDQNYNLTEVAVFYTPKYSFIVLI